MATYEDTSDQESDDENEQPKPIKKPESYSLSAEALNDSFKDIGKNPQYSDHMPHMPSFRRQKKYVLGSYKKYKPMIKRAMVYTFRISAILILIISLCIYFNVSKFITDHKKVFIVINSLVLFIATIAAFETSVESFSDSPAPPG